MKIFEISPCAPAEAHGHFFLISGREILREIWRDFCGISSDPQNEGSQISGKFRNIFREKIRASKKHFVPTSLCRRATPIESHRELLGPLSLCLLPLCLSTILLQQHASNLISWFDLPTCAQGELKVPKLVFHQYHRPSSHD